MQSKHYGTDEMTVLCHKLAICECYCCCLFTDLERQESRWFGVKLWVAALTRRTPRLLPQGRRNERLRKLVFSEQISAISEETIIFLVITRPLKGSKSRFLWASRRGTQGGSRGCLAGRQRRRKEASSKNVYVYKDWCKIFTNSTSY